MLNKLGKLLKYEFRFYARVLPPIYLVLALIALAGRFELIFSGLETPYLIIVYGCLVVAMLVINLIQILQRFTDNFMKSPGALMFTLPVTVWALTASKAIAAFCTILASGIAIFLSAFIYGAGQPIFQFEIPIPNDWLKFILAVLFIVFITFQQLCLIYTAITASHILPKFRVIACCAIYFVIIFFVGKIMGFLDVFGGQLLSQTLDVIVAFAFMTLFFWSTGFLLKRSYNLE